LDIGSVQAGIGEKGKSSGMGGLLFVYANTWHFSAACRDVSSTGV
jgi:hypothetical protein